MQRLFSNLRGGLAFIAAAMAGNARISELHANGKAEPNSGAFLHRGGPGTKAVKRAAQKRRNVQRHRAHCRG